MTYFIFIRFTLFIKFIFSLFIKLGFGGIFICNSCAFTDIIELKTTQLHSSLWRNLTKINEIIGPLTNSLYSNDGKRKRGRLLIKSAFDSIVRRVR